MATFDHVADERFRESLEADFAEMQRNLEAGAWKSVLVLAGSIVEALLIDYLTATTHPTRPAKDPLKMELHEAITICRSENVLSERSADLCSVVKWYRNLIHPGRLVRLDQRSPDKSSATIAVTLINLITDELAEFRRKTVGLTGQQIVSKLLKDPNALTILKHLIADVSEREQRRLLMVLIPSKYAELVDDDFVDNGPTRNRLSVAFRVVFEATTNDVKRDAANEFVRVLRDEDGDTVQRYREAFFRPKYIEFVRVEHRQMVMDHLIGSVAGVHTPESLEQLEGLAKHIAVGDVQKWLDSYVRTLISSTVRAFLKRKSREQLIESAFLTSAEVDEAIMRRFNDWISHFESRAAPEDVRLVKELREEFSSNLAPF